MRKKIWLLIVLIALLEYSISDDFLMARQAIGRVSQIVFPNYSFCHRCLMPWNLVNSHNTFYSKEEVGNEDDSLSMTLTKGCFALCERCWKELETPSARLPYYRQLYEEWESLGVAREWELIQEAVMSEESGDFV